MGASVKLVVYLALFPSLLIVLCPYLPVLAPHAFLSLVIHANAPMGGDSDFVHRATFHAFARRLMAVG